MPLSSEQIIKAAVKHFQLPDKIPMVYEGEVQDHGYDVWVEFRRLGPVYARHEILLTLDFAVMEVITASNNIYTSDKIVDELLELCTAFSWASHSGDIYCFEVRGDIRVTPWGRIGTDSQVKQTTVEVTYGTYRS